MRYVSTRGDPAERAFCDILLEGLAPDGGLYLPVRYPQVDRATMARWRNLPYAELAVEILSLYIDDIPADDLRAICRRVYSKAVFGTDAITRDQRQGHADGDGSDRVIHGPSDHGKISCRGAA